MQGAVVTQFTVSGAASDLNLADLKTRLAARLLVSTDRILLDAQPAPFMGRRRRLQSGSTSASTLVTLTLLTTDMDQNTIASVENTLATLLDNPTEFDLVTGLHLETVIQLPSLQNVAAVTPQGLETSPTGGDGGGSGWMGGLFGSLGLIFGLFGLYMWYRSKKASEARMSLIVDGRERGVTLAKRSVMIGHAAGSEMVARPQYGEYGSQLSSAI
jgi:hypothetical protein